MFPKSIHLFLIDGLADGRCACELSNWSGKAYKIPRTLISESKDREDLTSTGIYFLIGKGDTPEEKSKIYIGEAENLLDRLKQHLTGKDFWHEAIVFFSKDENLNKAKVKYMERKFYDLACLSGRYDVLNRSIPTQSRVSEADRAELEEFMFNAKMLTNILGHRSFETVPQMKSYSEKEAKFYIQSTRGADAVGMPVSDGFVVFSGSKVAKEISPAFKKHNYIKLWHSLMETGVLSHQDESLVFGKDYVFSSASAAAAIVKGQSANGLMEWKTSIGQSLKDLEKIKS
ncbi:MAG: GIY-YIG nuclease family protein [Mariprofundaceae bacterium]|nr:GIY-YIG nuclease family protein [Mariprofundaceae bacterium]